MSSYDKKLLDEVPKATRAQLQEGYSVDLLEQPPRRTPPVGGPPPPQSPPPAVVPLTLGTPETDSGEKFRHSASTPTVSKSRTSFWRSRNGIIAIIVIALVIVGAVVGGAVGGTAKKGNNAHVSTGSTTPAPTTQTTQGPGGVSTKGATSGGTNATPIPTAGGQNSGGQVIGK